MPSESYAHNEGLCNEAIHRVYRPWFVIVGNLLYAVSACWGFASAADRQRLEALINRGICSGHCSPDIPILLQKRQSIDDELFQRICTTLTMSFTTFFLQDASLCIILDKDTMKGN